MPEKLAKRLGSQQSWRPQSSMHNDRQPQAQHAQQQLLSSISALREQLDAKILLAKRKLDALTKPTSEQQAQTLATVPKVNAVHSATVVAPTESSSQATPVSNSRGRRELKSKLARVRLDFDLLLAKQRCLMEQRKLQQMRQQKQQQQQQQRLRRRKTGLIFKYSIRTLRSPQQRKTNLPATAKGRRRLSSAFSWRRHQEVFPGSNPTGISKSPSSICSPSALMEPKVKRSRSLVERAKLRLRKRMELCVFYCRFGYCRLAAGCQYLHDPKKVAICRRFLRNNGACADPGCRLSHCLDPTKLPQCEFHPACGRPGCPYAHAKLPFDAPLCRQFSRLGHCPRGVACPQRHTWPQAKRRRSRSSGSNQVGAGLPDEAADKAAGHAAAAPSAAAPSAAAHGAPVRVATRGLLPAYIPVPRPADSTLDEDAFDFD